jgi:hypothetical protein
MKLSRYSQNRLFGSFSIILNAPSCPTYPSMSFEGAFKIMKKTHKNPSFGISG